MGRRGAGTLERDEEGVGTLEVEDRWTPPPVEDRERRRRPVAAIVVSVVVAAGALITVGTNAPGGGTGAPAASRAPVAAPSVEPPRLAQPLGHRVVTLTLTGLAVVDLDAGTFTLLELGAVRSFGSGSALVALDRDRVAVVFGDRSVGVVDLVERSVTRVAEGAHSIVPASQPDELWVRRLRPDDGWELTQIDATGRNRSVAMHHPGATPPRMVGGRPVLPGGGEPVLLSAPEAPYRVEVVEHRRTLQSWDVLVTDVVSGAQRRLDDLDSPPVVSPDGRRLLVGHPAGNRLTVHDLADGTSETVDVPRAGSVGLDWTNMALLPAPAPTGEDLER